MSPDCENKPFWSFGHSREIVGSSIFRYHEWVLTLNFGQTLKLVVCGYIFSKLHSSQGMFAGNVHKTIQTGQTRLNRYRHFLVVLLSGSDSWLCYYSFYFQKRYSAQIVSALALRHCDGHAVHKPAAENGCKSEQNRHYFILNWHGKKTGLSQILVVPCVSRLDPPQHSSDVASPLHFPRVLTPILSHQFWRQGTVLEEIRAKRR